MRKVLGFLVVVAAAGGAAAQPALESPRYVSPSALAESKALTAEGYAKNYPKGLKGRPGEAIVECRLTGAGPLTDCTAIAEWPKGAGVGEAAVKLAKRVAAKAADDNGVSTEGAYIALWMPFRTTYKLAGESRLLPGDPAFIVTRTPIGKPRAKSPCPTAADPQGQCYLHLLHWETRLNFPSGVRFVQRVGKTTGASSLNCALDADRRPNRCEGSPDLTPEQVAILQDMLGRFQAREIAEDAVLSANTRIAVFFEWAQLSEAANASAMGRAR